MCSTSTTDAAAANPNGFKMLLAYDLSTFSIKGKLVLAMFLEVYQEIILIAVEFSLAVEFLTISS